MHRPSYDILLERLTNQTEVVSWCPATATIKVYLLMLDSAQHVDLDGEALDLKTCGEYCKVTSGREFRCGRHCVQDRSRGASLSGSLCGCSHHRSAICTN